MPSFPLRARFVPYPLWRRRLPVGLGRLASPIFRRFLAAEADLNPPRTPEAMAAYLMRWALMPDAAPSEVVRMLADNPAAVEEVALDRQPPVASSDPVRLPAQWEPVETVVLAWPVLYPPLWTSHAAMAEAIAPVAAVTIVVPSPLWTAAIRWYLNGRGRLSLDRLRFLSLPTDDIWVRDYGPIVGLDEGGQRVCVKAVFDPLPVYPQQRDNAMALRWAAHHDVPVKALDLHLEGGNIWSDGQGTLILADQVFRSNPGLTRDALLDRLRAVFKVEKLIITPRLEREETGHVDLLVKLAGPDTVLVTAPTLFYNGRRLGVTAEQFRRATSAAGRPYHVIELPAPPFYLNWGIYPVWRSYTNALTVNGRILVPVFDLPSDQRALDLYAQAMPGFEVIPVDCSAAANGGGAVHCLTKEIPAVPAGRTGSAFAAPEGA